MQQPFLIASVLRSRGLLLLAFVALSSLVVRTSSALAQAELAGVYKAGPSQTKVDVSTWGKDCGPRPVDATDTQASSVTVSVQGKQLTLAFPGRTVRSDGCWSPNPGVRVASSTATGSRWHSECQTPDSDPKREHGGYTLTLSAPDVLDLLEESAYDWQLNESRCVAKVRITQRIARGAAAAEASKPLPATCTPGPLARLRLRPSSLRIGPGERSCFSVRATDAAGCALSEVGPLKWDLNKPAGASATLVGGCFKAADRAAEAEGKFEVSVSSEAVHDSASVLVASTDLSDITARRGAGGSELEVEDGDDSVSSFGIEAAVKRSSTEVKVALAALLLALLAGLAWLAASAGKKQREKQRLSLADRDTELGLPLRSAAPVRPSAPKPSAPSSGPPSAGEQLICPQCRHGYPGGTLLCPRDATALIPYAEFVRKARESDAVPRTCTECGAQLAAGATFCGVCGAKVRS